MKRSSSIMSGDIATPNLENAAELARATHSLATSLSFAITRRSISLVFLSNPLTMLPKMATETIRESLKKGLMVDMRELTVFFSALKSGSIIDFKT